MTSCTVTTTGALGGRRDEVGGVHDVDRPGPVLGAGPGGAAFPELADDPGRESVGSRHATPGGTASASAPAAAPGERVCRDVTTSVRRASAREEPGGDLADAGTVAEQRSAVDRDPEGVDRSDLTGSFVV